MYRAASGAEADVNRRMSDDYGKNISALILSVVVRAAPCNTMHGRTDVALTQQQACISRQYEVCDSAPPWQSMLQTSHGAATGMNELALQNSVTLHTLRVSLVKHRLFLRASSRSMWNACLAQLPRADWLRCHCSRSGRRRFLRSLVQYPPQLQ